MSAFSDAVMALSPSSYWRFTGGNPMTDYGSQAKNLIAYGVPTRSASLVPGEASAANESMTLAGTPAQYLQGANLYSFQGDVDWTMMLWFRPTSTDFGGVGFQRLLEKRSSGGANEGWTFNGSGSASQPWELDFVIDFGATLETATFNNLININTTYFLVLTWVDSTTTLSIYIDGSFVASDSTWTTPPGFADSGTQGFTIGARTLGANPFIGVVDDVAVWGTTALSGANITSLWNAAQVLSTMPVAWLAA